VSKKNKRRVAAERRAGSAPAAAPESSAAEMTVPANAGARERGPGGGRVRRPAPAAPAVKPAGRGLFASALGAFRGLQPVADGAPEAPASAEPEPTTALGRARRFADRHPMLVSWVALAIGMVAILVYTSRDVGLLPSQLAAMIVATILLAGACVWIISWE
jgi:hypothetical protein